jgi:hypothetical protein
MSTLPKQPKDVLAALRRYDDTIRHPALRRLDISDLYALFPDEPSAVGARLKWPNPWPNADSPGVYLIFGTGTELLYVGRAWNLNSRVSSYFRYASDGSGRCELRDEWQHRPAFVATIAVDDDKFFEAAGLEEYLIEALQPVENDRGIRG